MNLKKYLDKANEAEARVQSIAAQIDEHFEAGESGKALELKSQLDTAKADAKEAHELYVSMLNVSSGGSDPGQRFVPAGGNVQVVRDEADQPFSRPGEFFMAVKNAALFPAREDPRLRPLKVRDATGMSEGVPAEGGYLLQPQVSSPMVEKMYKTGELLSRITIDPVTGNAMTYNGVDESSRASGSRRGGVTGYWLAEGGTLTGSKPKFYQIELKVKKVGALCYATDEQLEDIANLESWLGRVAPEELKFQAEDAIFEGDGVGKPLGILNSPCLVSVLRYATSAVSFTDLSNMWARRWSGAKNYVWLINQDVQPQLDALTLTAGSTAVPPRFIDYGIDGVMRIKGAQVIEVEYASTMGTVGDIVLAALPEYQAIHKEGVKAASSIHVQFVTDETAFRFTYRIDGEPSWNSALTPFKGSNTQSPFVALATATA
jgi:HK97 family phage major capsid protein